MKNIKAFTLSEVLITLGIIGIAAAMTMPSLIGKYRSLVCATQLKKMYSVISQAMLMSVPDGDYENIPIKNGGTTGALNFFNDYLKKQFNIIKTCSSGQTGCGTNPVTKSGTSVNYMASDRINFITADGYTINVDTWNADDFQNVSNHFGVNVTGVSPMLVLLVDVNGPKKPNIIGKDVFAFVLTEKGVRPGGIDKTTEEIENECKTTGYYCFAKIMRNGWKIAPEDVF